MFFGSIKLLKYVIVVLICSIYIYIYMKSRSTGKEAAILNVDLLGVSGFYPDITAEIRWMRDHVGHQKTAYCTDWAFKMWTYKQSETSPWCVCHIQSFFFSAGIWYSQTVINRGEKKEVSLQLNIISGSACGGARRDNNPHEVKGEDKDTLHHSQTRTAQFQLLLSLKRGWGEGWGLGLTTCTSTEQCNQSITYLIIKICHLCYGLSCQRSFQAISSL